MVPPSPTAQAFSWVRSLLVAVTLFTMQTEFRLLAVGLVTLLMLTVCAFTPASTKDRDSRHSAKANFNENFIIFLTCLEIMFSEMNRRYIDL